jgi:hypothetical protein
MRQSSFGDMTKVRGSSMLKNVALWLACLLPFPGLAAVTKEYRIGNTGTIQMQLEDHWGEAAASPDARGTITIESKERGRLQFLLTPLPIGGADADVQQLVQQTANRIGPQSVEKALVIEPLRGAEVKGYYFKATDPAPKAGEYRFMYQGAVRIRSLLVMFTVLYNGAAERDAAAALAAIGGLTFRGPD